MINGVDLVRSHKIGLSGEENYIVTRGDVGYLRIVGSNPRWTVMTATADEDQGAIRACPNQLRLCEAATRLGIELQVAPYEQQDWKARPYIVICDLNLGECPSDALTDHADVTDLCVRFMGIYEGLQNTAQTVR